MGSIFEQDSGLGADVAADVVRGASRHHMGPIDRQAAVPVFDLSSSMGPHVAVLRESAGRFVGQLQGSGGRDSGFDFAAVGFNSTAWAIVKLAKAVDVRIDPSAFTTGGLTCYAGALEEAEKAVDEALARTEITQLKPVVVMFSDGGPNGRDFRPVAARLKTKADVVGLSLGRAATAALHEVASGPKFVKEASEVDDLKYFFAVLGASVSASKRAGMSLGQSVAAGLDLFGSRKR